MVGEAVRANAEAIKGLPPVASSQLCLGGDVLGGDQVSQAHYVGWSTVFLVLAGHEENLCIYYNPSRNLKPHFRKLMNLAIPLLRPLITSTWK